LNSGNSRKTAHHSRPARLTHAPTWSLCVGQEAEGQVELDLAHGVAGEDGVGGQAAAVAGRHPQAHGPLARGGRARRQLEQHEIQVAQHEEDQHRHRADHLPALALRADHRQAGQQGEGDQGGQHDQQVDQHGGGALAGVAQAQLQVDALRRDQRAGPAIVAGRRFDDRRRGGLGLLPGGLHRTTLRRRGR
jgi:hypothetical protein